ncbi:MAG: metal ABC transporter substrate-binding protein [Endomicrobiia bacterium]|nr:metal ABC transporter substrate-binding protein [Endomicrobiaceae bacterium]MDD3922114.1 metal ABC transporter substrate-binding protein [Endomicrobiaceae bacterium]MDD5101519.1 metal ABC transporter substrate-binding protein [Endomicrobiaceae bacterium]
MKFKMFIFILLISICLPYKSALSESRLPQKKIKITVTTSHLANLVNEICKDKVEIITMIQPTMCPSNNDIDPVLMKKIAKSNIILYHSWQPWVKSLKFKIGNLGIVYREFQTEGNLMIPYINVRGAEEIKNLFVVWDADNKNYYEQNFLNYIFKVNHLADEIAKNNVKRYDTKVACNNRISDFVQWLGFEVVIEYGKSEDIPSSEMMKLAKKIKTNKVKIIVDNLQVGTDIGRILSKDLKLKHIVISNFPLGNSYINTLKDNVAKLDKGL